MYITPQFVAISFVKNNVKSSVFSPYTTQYFHNSIKIMPSVVLLEYYHKHVTAKRMHLVLYIKLTIAKGD